MDFGPYVTLLVLNWIAIGLPIAALVMWKKKEIKIFKHIIPFAFFAVFDIVGLAMGTILVPSFLPAMMVLLLGIHFRQSGWPTTPKFAANYKIYILIIALCLEPALNCLNIAYYSSLPVSVGDIAKLMVPMMGGILIPGLVFAFSDPTNRYGQREPENLVGAGFAFIGVIFGLVLMFVLLSFIDVFAWLFTILALVATVLISLPFFLPANKTASELTPT